jgi:AcrR family transcriptional regulator
MSLEKIRLEAINQFAEKGFDGTSIKDITKVVGITPPAVYAHFKSKEHMFISILSECLENLISDVDVIINDPSGNVSTKLSEIYCFYVGELTSFKPEIVLLVRSSMFPSESLRSKTTSMVLDAHRQVGTRIRALIEEGINQKLIKALPVERIYKQFYRLITAHVYQVFSFKVTINEEEKRIEWEEFWNSIKY